MLFDKRQENKNYQAINGDRFIPFDITKTTLAEFEKKEKELRDNFDDLSIPAGLDPSTYRTLMRMRRDMYRLRLDEDFNIEMPLSDYLSEAPSGASQVASNVQPLPQQPMPVVQQQPQQFSTATGLTPTENALLSDEEKQIRLRQRGFTNYG